MTRGPGFARWAVAAALAAAPHSVGEEAADPGFFDALKDIPLTPGGDVRLSLGGEVRQQFETFGSPDFDAAGGDVAYLLQRYTLDAEIAVKDYARVFVELYSAPVAFQDGPPGPFDQDVLRVHQAFGEATLGEDRRWLRFRIGRQEMVLGSQRFVSRRAGPNVRRSFDAVEAWGNAGDWTASLFLARPVEVDPPPLHDWGEDDETIWGLYTTRAIDAIDGGLDLYYLGYDRPDARFVVGTADETRHTFGVRAFGERRGLDFDAEAAGQIGSFGEGDVSAWTLALDAGYTVETAAWTPRLGLRGSVISGDTDPDDGDLGTFNALYPRGNYFGESAVIGPANLLHIQPNLQLTPTDAVTLEAGWSFFWRYSDTDGLYTPSGSVIRGGGPPQRYIGSEASLALEWAIHENLGLSASVARIFAGDYLKAVGPGDDLDYAQVALTLEF